MKKISLHGRPLIQKYVALSVLLMLCFSCCTAQADFNDPFDPTNQFLSTEAMGFPSLTKTDFDMADLPENYLTPSDNPGRVEELSYATYTNSPAMPFVGAFTTSSADTKVVKSVMIYLPAGYDETDEPYNVLYLLHGSSSSHQRYLNPNEPTGLQCLLDHMIEDGIIEPMIVVAATYYSQEEIERSMPLAMQVSVTQSFPRELVEDIVPLVEGRYRTYAESTTLDGIVASREHRAIGGFSLGAVGTWNVFLQQMQAFKWFIPISEASWDDGEGGITGILDSDVSAQALYEAVIEQGYGAEDFMLFVATGSDDEAFEIATNQMKSLLEYSDMFKVGENTSCSMMSNGTHTTTALYTYCYHILPALFSDSPTLQDSGMDE